MCLGSSMEAIDSSQSEYWTTLTLQIYTSKAATLIIFAVENVRCSVKYVTYIFHPFSLSPQPLVPPSAFPLFPSLPSSHPQLNSGVQRMDATHRLIPPPPHSDQSLHQEPAKKHRKRRKTISSTCTRLRQKTSRRC